MIVYRVESVKDRDPRTRLGCGPYAGSWYVEASPETKDAIDYLTAITLPTPECQRLTPNRDPLLGWIRESEVCGFDTLGALETWFDKALQPLLRAGFTIARYEVPSGSVRCGLDGQVLFPYREAKKVESKETVA